MYDGLRGEMERTGGAEDPYRILFDQSPIAGARCRLGIEAGRVVVLTVVHQNAAFAAVTGIRGAGRVAAQYGCDWNVSTTSCATERRTIASA